MKERVTTLISEETLKYSQAALAKFPTGSEYIE